jgi:hypothetical protein
MDSWYSVTSCSKKSRNGEGICNLRIWTQSNSRNNSILISFLSRKFVSFLLSFRATLPTDSPVRSEGRWHDEAKSKRATYRVALKLLHEISDSVIAGNKSALELRLQVKNLRVMYVCRNIVSKNSVAWARERIIPTEQPPLVGEVSANFWGSRMPRGQRDGSLRPYSRFYRPEPQPFLSSSSSIVLTRLSGPRSRPTTSQKIWSRRESYPMNSDH